MSNKILPNQMPTSKAARRADFQPDTRAASTTGSDRSDRFGRALQQATERKSVLTRSQKSRSQQTRAAQTRIDASQDHKPLDRPTNRDVAKGGENDTGSPAALADEARADSEASEATSVGPTNEKTAPSAIEDARTDIAAPVSDEGAIDLDAELNTEATSINLFDVSGENESRAIAEQVALQATATSETGDTDSNPSETVEAIIFTQEMADAVKAEFASMQPLSGHDLTIHAPHDGIPVEIESLTDATLQSDVNLQAASAAAESQRVAASTTGNGLSSPAAAQAMTISAVSALDEANIIADDLATGDVATPEGLPTTLSSADSPAADPDVASPLATATAANADTALAESVPTSSSINAAGIAAPSSVANGDSVGQVTDLEASTLSNVEAAELAALEEDGSADSVVRQVKRAIGAIRNAGGGDHEFKIRLVPRELGSVTIGIQTSEAGVTIGLVTETSAASDRLNEQRQQLMDELAQSGLDSSNVDISHQGQNQGQFGSDSGPETSGLSASADSSAASAAEAAAPATGVNRSTTPGRLDVAL